MMKKQYEMPNLYVVEFTGEVDTAVCSGEDGTNWQSDASTFVAPDNCTPEGGELSDAPFSNPF